MKPSHPPKGSAFPDELRKPLEPFASIFEEIILRAARGRSRPSGRKISATAAAVEIAVQAALGHPLHPVINCFALQICCRAYYRTVEALEPTRDWERQMRLADGASYLIAKLEEHYGTYELKLMAY